MDLTNLASSATVAENTANATPQLLDATVTFTHDSDDFDGGALTVSGLLPEDRVSLANGSTIYLDGATVMYDADGAGGGAAIAIGTASGGSGATFTVTFNGNATAASVEAVIESLTYANVSDTPTASRTLAIGITDAAGDDLTGPLAFSQVTGAGNPLNGFDVGFLSAPALGDLDGDGDLDAVVGEYFGSLVYFENTGTAAAPSFTVRSGASNPFDGVDVGVRSTPALADLDNDGDLDAVIGTNNGSMLYFQNTGTALDPVFTERTGSDNPFNGFVVGTRSNPTLVDLDGDGDLDAVIGQTSGTLSYFENTGSALAPVFEARTGGSNPFDSVDLSEFSMPAFADLDGDGDLDAVLGETDGIVNFFENTGTASAPVFVRRTGGQNPFDGFDVGLRSAPALGDLDGDGDLDVVVGEQNGTLLYLRNTTAHAPTITVTVTAEADAPSATGLPSDVTVTEDVAGNLDLSSITLSDPDSGSLTVVLTASAGTMTAASGAVTVSGSGTGTLTLTGTVLDLGDFLAVASNIQYTGAANASGNNAATLTITADDGSGAVTLGTVNIDITAVDDPMSLTGLASSATFNENTVNATPQLLDADVTLVHGDNDYNGGTLTVSGLLAEDRVSIASGATISLSSGTVYYDADGAGGAAAVAIGTASGGSGATFTVTFNANATSAAVDALIQSLTYANVSDTPTASRTLKIGLTDGAGGSLQQATPSFTLLDDDLFFSAAQPIPALGDIDGDGDLDLVVGYPADLMDIFTNQTNGAPGFSGSDDFAYATFIEPGYIYSAPVLVDLDQDGDQDLVVGELSGSLLFYRNGTDGTAGALTAVTGGDNPFDRMDFGFRVRPAFADLDGDGDLDLVIGDGNGVLTAFRNGTDGAPGAFTELTGGDNPFNGVDVGEDAAPTFADLDGDGDLDLIVGNYSREFSYFRNGTDGASGAFVEQTGVDNPLDDFEPLGPFAPGMGFGGVSATFGDLDGDGDLDLVVGEYFQVNIYRNDAPQVGTITVTVTAQNDIPTAAGLPTDVTVTEDVASNLDLSAVTIADPDAAGTITVTLTASAGTMTATSGGGVTVDTTFGNVLVLTGTASDIDAFLNTASNIAYTGAANANGNNAATITVTANDGSGSVTLGTVNVDITAVDDPMTLTGVTTGEFFMENTVNATPQVLDADVTFTHGDNTYNGGTLVVSGLLAEDRVSIASGAIISLSAGTVYYDADGAGGASPVAIGTVSGGSGSTFTVTFNGAATSTAIDLLIQSLTYANVSDTPSKDRILSLQITDAVGDHLASAADIIISVTAEADGPTGGSDTFTGTSGNDTVKGLGGDDVLGGGDGNDTVEGGDGDDTLTGGAGNDLLSGGVGADDMAGGLGDDIYVVNDAGDVVDETGGDGYDTVRTSISYTLTAGVERLELMFSGSINGTGNALANVIVGNGGANVLSGLAGNDTLTGLSGNDTLNGGDDDDSLDGGVGNDTLNGGAGVDTLIGGAGADRLDGGTGADTMTGGASNDTYVVDNPGDSITETSGGGTDTVEASIGYTLGSEVENLTLTGSSAINGTGNDLKNTLTGNGAANTLTGLAGADVLSGQGGDDRLIGGAGADSLTGGTGADTFVFSNADIGAKAEVDKILDLVFADGDVIDLSGIDANTNLANDQAFVFVTRFTKQAGQAVMTYANGITTLQLDVNGDGKVDYKLQITGDVTGTKTNLYTDGGGDTDGGWIL